MHRQERPILCSRPKDVQCDDVGVVAADDDGQILLHHRCAKSLSSSCLSLLVNEDKFDEAHSVQGAALVTMQSPFDGIGQFLAKQ